MNTPHITTLRQTLLDTLKEIGDIDTNEMLESAKTSVIKNMKQKEKEMAEMNFRSTDLNGGRDHFLETPMVIPNKNEIHADLGPSGIRFLFGFLNGEDSIHCLAESSRHASDFIVDLANTVQRDPQ